MFVFSTAAMNFKISSEETPSASGCSGKIICFCCVITSADEHEKAEMLEITIACDTFFDEFLS